MDKMPIQGGRKTKMYGGGAKQLFLKELLKKLEKDEIIELLDIGFEEDDMLNADIIFNSNSISKDYNLRSKIMSFRNKSKKDAEGFYVGVRNGNMQIMRLAPHNPKFAYCMDEQDTGSIKLWMNIDRNASEEQYDGSTFWHNYIRNSRPDERTVKVNRLTKDIKVNTFTASTLKYLAQPDYATRLEKCGDFTGYLKKHGLKEQDYVLFIL